MLPEENGDYSLTWKIDNFSLCPQKNGEFLQSPFFTAENVGNSIWRILLYPKGRDESSEEYISLFLLRSTFDILNDVNYVDVKFDIVKPDGNIRFFLKGENLSFSRGKLWGAKMVMGRDQMAQMMEDWKKDTLFLRCTITNRKKLNCVSQTTIDADCYIFKRKVENRNGSIHPIKREFSMCDTSTFEIDLISSEDDVKLLIRKREIVSTLPKMLSCRISVLDGNGSEINSKRAVHLFESIRSSVWEFPAFIIAKHLKSTKNNSFVLLFEFSTLKGKDPIYVMDPICNSYTEKNNIINLKENLKNMHKLNLHSDIELHVEGKVFPAHKCILATRSPVFSAMFAQDMIETQTGIITIEDVETDIFESFLNYMYTASVDDVNYETAKKLIIVADRYQVIPLMIDCSRIMRTHLSLENIFEVLNLVDMLNYKPMKVFISDYIAEHAKEILTSSEWMMWAVKNTKLAAEVMSNLAMHFDVVPKKINK